MRLKCNSLALKTYNVSYLDGLGRVGQPLLHVIQQHPSKAQLVMFVQQSQQGFLVLQIILWLEPIRPIPDINFWVVDQGLRSAGSSEGDVIAKKNKTGCLQVSLKD